MLCETRAIADFERRSSAERTAISDASTSGSVVEMALGAVNLIVFVSDEASESGSVGDASRADLLAAVMRLLPKEEPIRVVNVGDGNLRHVFAKFRDRSGSDRCLLMDLRTSADPAIAQLADALLKTERVDDALSGLYDVLSGWRSQHTSRATMTAAMLQPKRNRRALPKWRLKRVLANIDANLGEPVALADLAAAAELTRMHNDFRSPGLAKPVSHRRIA